MQFSQLPRILTVAEEGHREADDWILGQPKHVRDARYQYRKFTRSCQYKYLGRAAAVCRG